MTKTSFRRMLWKTPMRDLVRGRITGRLDIDRLLEESGLSGPAADKVRGVVKRTRLWRLEKVDVANELIAHFLDGLEAGTSIDDLLETFGDERQTAKLIRRAKTRQRPMVWHALKWFRRSVAVVFTVYLLMLGYFLTGSPDVKVDYVAVLNAKAVAVPEDQRAWPLYREALTRMDLDREREWDTPTPYYRDMTTEDRERQDEEYEDELRPPYQSTLYDRLRRSFSPDDPGWDETARFLREQAEALALIRQGAARPGLGLTVGFKEDFDPKDWAFFYKEGNPDLFKNTQVKTFDDPDRLMIGVVLPQLGKMRQMALLLCADARLAAIDGDSARAYGDVIAMIGMAEHCREHALLINELVAMSIQRLAIAELAKLQQQQPEIFSDKQLRNLAHVIASHDLSMDAALRGEELWLKDLVQRIYTDDGHGDGRLTPEGLKVLHSVIGSSQRVDVDLAVGSDIRQVLGPATMLAMASRKELVDTHRHLMDMARVQATKPLWEQAETDPIGREFESWPTWKRMKYVMLTQLIPATDTAVRANENHRGFRDGVLIGIALELYRREHGDWPGALDELVPGYLPKVPADRLTGEAVRYRILEGGPVVYSVGVDGDDDGGRVPMDMASDPKNEMASPSQFGFEDKRDEKHDGDWVLWPVPGEG
jgi:hypothetical protein